MRIEIFFLKACIQIGIHTQEIHLNFVRLVLFFFLLLVIQLVIIYFQASGMHLDFLFATFVTLLISLLFFSHLFSLFLSFRRSLQMESLRKFDHS